MAHKRDVKDLVKKLTKLGWNVVQAPRNPHYKAYPPKGEGYVLISESPSCSHWRQNCLGDIRRLCKANGIPLEGL